jgi:hypothetical protein
LPADPGGPPGEAKFSVTVMDQERRPLGDAAVAMAPRPASAYQANIVKHLGLTDPTGTLEASASRLREEGLPSILVQKLGYVSGNIDDIEGGKHYEILLAPSAILRVRTIESSGRPVAGVVVVAYEASAVLDFMRWFEGDLPLAAFRNSSCYGVGRTGADGVAEVHLPRRRYSIAAFGRSHAMAAVPGSVDLGEGAPRDQTIEMARVMAAVCEIVDANGMTARVLGRNVKYSKRARPVTNMFARMQRDQMIKALASAGDSEAKNRIVAVDVVSDDDDRIDHVATITAMIEGHGPMTFEAQMGEAIAPTQHRIIASGKAESLGRFLVGSQDASVREFISDSIAVTFVDDPEDRANPEVVFRVTAGESYSIPAGRYRIVRREDRQVVKQVEVVAGSSIDVSLTPDEVGCHLRIVSKLSSGESPYGLKINVTSAQSSHFNRTYRPDSPVLVTIPLPEGVYDVTLEYGGRVKRNPSIVVRPGLTRLDAVLDFE